MMKVAEKLWNCRADGDVVSKGISQKPNSQVHSRHQYCIVIGPRFYVHLKRFPAQTVSLHMDL